jgi:hypothetical protein
MLQSILTSNLAYGIDNGPANVVQATFPIPVASLVDGMDVWVKIKATNTTATTFTPNPGVISAAPVVGAAHTALQGNELVANGRANFIWRQDISSWVLMECSGGSLQIAPATASNQAVTFGQVSGVVGQTCNLLAGLSAASASLAFTADEVIVESALGGLRYCVSSLNESLNLATTGAGGMDTGAAPASSFVGIYVIYNPTTKDAALLGVNAAAANLPMIYGGGHMPAGYTASALISVLPTNASAQFPAITQSERKIGVLAQTAVSTGSTFAYSGFNVSTVIPENAKSISGVISVTNSGASGPVTLSIALYEGAQGVGSQTETATGQMGTTGGSCAYRDSKIFSQQTAFLGTSVSGSGGGTPSFVLIISGYEV